MYAAGYGPYMVNFVHDEVIYELPPKVVRQHIPRIEKLMIAGMKTVIPDVKVGVESSVMLHWDKKAVVEYNDLEYDKQGNPVLQEPPKVREIWKQACNSL